MDSLTGRVDDRAFNSSKELFLALKRSFKRGTALQMGNVLIELHVVWAKHLRNYARRVLEWPPPMTRPPTSALPQCNLDGGAQQLVRGDQHVRVLQQDDGAARRLDRRQGRRGLKEKVDLETPQEHFRVITAGMKVPVAALETRVANGFTAMRAVKWETMERWARMRRRSWRRLWRVPRDDAQLGETLNPLYVRFFCDKFVKAFVPRLIYNIYRCKRIGEVGATDADRCRHAAPDPRPADARPGGGGQPVHQAGGEQMAVAEHIRARHDARHLRGDRRRDARRRRRRRLREDPRAQGLAADWTGAEKARRRRRRRRRRRHRGRLKIKEAMAAKLRGMGA